MIRGAFSNPRPKQPSGQLADPQRPIGLPQANSGFSPLPRSSSETGEHRWSPAAAVAGAAEAPFRWPAVVGLERVRVPRKQVAVAAGAAVEGCALDADAEVHRAAPGAPWVGAAGAPGASAASSKHLQLPQEAAFDHS